MINLRGMDRVCILGGGTAGWFAALEMRQLFSPSVEVMVISAPEVPIVGVGEGGVLNLVQVLKSLDIDLLDFIQQTGSTVKLGFRYERWRTGSQNDYYYHLFPTKAPELDWCENGFYPYLSLMLNHGYDVSSYMNSLSLSESRTPQEEVLAALMHGNNNFGASLHFDTFRVGQYLKKVALSRGIIYQEGFVQDLIIHPESGDVMAVQLANKSPISCNFLIDASGFARLAIGNKYKSKWHSFADSLIMNKALPFHLGHPTTDIELVTRATAMSSGWLWQIPLQERIGAGYVYNDSFLTEDQALEEVEKFLGCAINPVRTISFESGYFEKVWIRNVVAIGLASGFVEPLEATSIGQMLAQLAMISTFIRENHGVIPSHSIDYFNQHNAQYWRGIGDFVRMHYDTGRSDTLFWKNMLSVPMSEAYMELKQCWKERTPRKMDFASYEMDGALMFDVPSWLAVGVGVKIISPEATAAELMALKPEQHQLLANYLNQLKIRSATKI